MDEPLRTGLWNVTYHRYMSSWEAFSGRSGYDLLRVLWVSEFHRDLAMLPDDRASAANFLRPIFLKGEWYEVYDLVQAILEANPEPTLEQAYGDMLEMHLAGYRLIAGEVVPISDKEEVAEIEAALSVPGAFHGAKHGVRNALALYSNREAPDYANAIKEAISAVESAARELTGRKELGPALDQLRKEHPDIHPALIAGWKSLYGFTSDADSIRHGGIDAPNVTQDLARYFIVSSSAFVNYLVTLAA